MSESRLAATLAFDFRDPRDPRTRPPMAAQPTPGSQQGLGLTGADIPPLLKTVKADPYRAPAEPALEPPGSTTGMPRSSIRLVE